MAEKKAKPGFKILIFLVFIIFIFGLGFYIGQNKQQVFSTAKKVIPPLVKKAELTVKNLFGITKHEPTKTN